MERNTTKIIICIVGGNVQAIRGTEIVKDVEIFDVDNLIAEGIASSQIDEKWLEKMKEYTEVLY